MTDQEFHRQAMESLAQGNRERAKGEAKRRQQEIDRARLWATKPRRIA